MQERLPRVPFTRPVFVTVAGAAARPRRLLAANVSNGGMFVRSEARPRPGTKLSLSLEARGQVLAFAEGEVIWCTDPASANQQNRLPGFGVRFVRFLHPRSEDLLDHLVHRKAALLPPELANQVIGEPEQPSVPAASADLTAQPSAQPPMVPPTRRTVPADFMARPISELTPQEPAPVVLAREPAPSTLDFMSKPIAELTATEPAASSAEVSDAPSLAAEIDLSEEHSESGTSADFDVGSRVWTALLLVAFLVVVALGMLWIVRRDATPPAAGNQVQLQTQAQATTEPLDVAPLIPAEPFSDSDSVDAPVEMAAAPKRAAKPASIPAAAKPIPAPAATPAPARQAARSWDLPSGAVTAVALSSEAKTITAALELESGAAVDRVFILKAPSRVVVDLTGPAPKGSGRVEVNEAAVQSLRTGSREGGTRLVIDLGVAAKSASLEGHTVRVQLE